MRVYLDGSLFTRTRTHNTHKSPFSRAETNFLHVYKHLKSMLISSETHQTTNHRIIRNLITHRLFCSIKHFVCLSSVPTIKIHSNQSIGNRSPTQKPSLDNKRVHFRTETDQFGTT
ncbi:hypothetical protein HanLR1_Chr17g0655011 [Helianthus annuus]|nr:hypothetical protein HanLR1_Chr17g0655011 [Helianthus annuus]